MFVKKPLINNLKSNSPNLSSYNSTSNSLSPKIKTNNNNNNHLNSPISTISRCDVTAEARLGALKELKKEIGEREEQRKKLAELKNGLKTFDAFSFEAINDIAYIMTNREKLKRIHRTMIATGLPLTVLQWAGIILWITKGIWWLFAVWLIVSIPYGYYLSRWYFRRTAYICPQCHTVFQPSLKEAFWANHNPAARKLTCPSCGHHGFCVETWGGEIQ